MTRDTMGIVHIIDDDRDLGQAIARLLRRKGYATTAFESAADWLADPCAPDANCLVSDILIGEVNAFDLTGAMRARAPATAIVFMTGWPTTSDAVDEVRVHGGIDYLEKPIDEARLSRAVLEGVNWSVGRSALAARTARLTQREREVLERLAAGHTNKEIAHDLSLSIKTIEDHRAAIKVKTGAQGLADLIALTRP